MRCSEVEEGLGTHLIQTDSSVDHLLVSTNAIFALEIQHGRKNESSGQKMFHWFSTVHAAFIENSSTSTTIFYHNDSPWTRLSAQQLPLHQRSGCSRPDKSWMEGCGSRLRLPACHDTPLSLICVGEVFMFFFVFIGLLSRFMISQYIVIVTTKAPPG